MQTLVMKFGGASMATTENFLHIADIILTKAQNYQKIVVVVSAMGNTTDQLLSLAKKVHPNPPKREQDMLVSVGERISISLLAMALSYKGKDAVSFTGSQSGIITTDDHSDAKILDVKPTRVLKHLEQGQIVIVAGFQGVSLSKEITTLGRGGSDTSAVALAVSLDSKKVEFYKDVDGIYNEDPKKNKNAKKFASLTYDEAIEFARKGAEVLHARAITLAKKNQIQLEILSFEDGSTLGARARGTLIGATIKQRSSCLYEDHKCLA